MQTHRFMFQGFSRSYWDFFYGYGLFAAFTCVVEAVLFWQLGSLDRRLAAPVLILFAAANVVYAALCWQFFFLTPLVFDLAIAACLALALAI